MVSSAAFILSAKALLISIGAASMAFLLKVSVPLIVEFMISQVPLLWSSILSWLRPPYLYIIINGIIISIAASSRLHRSDEISQEEMESPLVEAGGPDDRSSEMGGALEPEDDLVLQEKRFPEEVTAYDAAVEGSDERDDEEEKEEEFVISKSTWTPAKRSDSPVQEYLPQPSEKPLVSSRFVHRRLAKSSPEGTKALKVARPNRHETLENTWKAITEGRPMPLTRQLRKSDSWENGHGHQAQLQLSSPQQHQKMMRKSETFRDRTNEQEWSQSPGTLRRAASPSKDELNRRVEAFIRKFNEEMRLQRQESLNHYKEMISRSADDY